MALRPIVAVRGQAARPGCLRWKRRLGNGEGRTFGIARRRIRDSTAPNRPFADLVTQRMLRAATGGGGAPYSDEQLIEIANRCTERGDAARKVERTMRKVIGASLLAERVGESFAAVVTAASPKGTYARVLSPPVEGRIVRGVPAGVGERYASPPRADPGRGFITRA